MRILLTSDPEIPVPPTNYGGIQRIIDQLANYLIAEGHEVGLIANPESTIKLDSFYSWAEDVSQGSQSLLKNTLALYRACANFQPDIVHNFARLAYCLPRLILKRPTLMSYQRTPGATQLRMANKLSGGTVFFSGCSEYITSLGNPNAEHWTTIPNFLPKNLYLPNLELSDDAPLVFLSRLDKIKGVHTAIKLAKDLNERLIIAGNIPDTTCGKRYFEEEVQPLLSSDIVTYIGPVDDRAKQDLLAKAKALLLPIEWDEPFGIVFIEALACGTPVITAPRGAAREIVDHGKSGFLCDSYDSYVAAISEASSINRAFCRHRFEQLYTTEIVGKKYIDTYLKCIQHSR